MLIEAILATSLFDFSTTMRLNHVQIEKDIKRTDRLGSDIAKIPYAIGLRPHQYNDGLPSAQAEHRYIIIYCVELVDHYTSVVHSSIISAQSCNMAVRCSRYSALLYTALTPFCSWARHFSIQSVL